MGGMTVGLPNANVRSAGSPASPGNAPGSSPVVEGPRAPAEGGGEGATRRE